MADIKQRFDTACRQWQNCDSQTQFWKNWRGSGNGLDDSPCVALVQYARSVGCSEKAPELLAQLDNILNADLDTNDQRAAAVLGDASDESDRTQLTSLVCGLAAVVKAAVEEEKTQSSKNKVDEFLRRAATEYALAWRPNIGYRSIEDFQFGGSDPYRGVAPQDDPAGLLVNRALGNFEVMHDPPDSGSEYDTQTVRLILRRLLHQLLVVKYDAADTSESPSVQTDSTTHYKNDVKILLVGSDGYGHVGRATVEHKSEVFHGVYPDPLAVGVTVLDDDLQRSLGLAWKSAWQSRKTSDVNVARAVRVSPVLPVAVPILKGDSAGAILGCTVYSTARQEPIDKWRTASASLRIVTDKPMSKWEYNLFIDEEVHGEIAIDQWALGPVGGMRPKMAAAAEYRPPESDDRIEEVVWSESQAKEWNAHDPSASYPKATGASTPAQLLGILQADRKHELLLERLCEANMIEVDRLGRPQQQRKTHVAGDEHRLDCYIPPDYTIEERRRDDRSLAERIPVPGDGLEALQAILQHLLKEQAFLVTHDDAGAGKTVFSYQCFAALSRDLSDENCLFKHHYPLVVRWHGGWPEHNGRLLSVSDAIAYEVVQQFERCDEQSNGYNASDVQDAVDYALKHNRVILILDGFDQFDPKHQTYVASLLPMNDRLVNADSHAESCRWIVTGRSYAIHNKRSKLFNPDRWRFARIERFNQRQWEDYFQKNSDDSEAARVVAQRWQEMVPDPQAVADLLGLPLILREIRTIIETSTALDPQAALPVFWTKGELHECASDLLLKRAVELEELELPDDAFVRLRAVIGLLAFQLMLDCEDYNGSIVGSEEVTKFRQRAKTRWLAGATAEIVRDPEQFDRDVAMLEKIELSNRGVLDKIGKTALSFRDTKTMEWYAARYLTHHATHDDVFASDQPAAINFMNDDDWSNCWKLAIAMPRDAINPSVAAQSLSALLHQPASGVRPTELIFLAWPLFEYDRLLAEQLLFVAKNSDGRPERDHGKHLVERNLIDETKLRQMAQAVVLPDAPRYLEEFRHSSRELAAELEERSRVNLPKRVRSGLPLGWQAKLRWLLRLEWLLGTPWQRASSRIKSHTLLQCPPQSLIDSQGDAACVGLMDSPSEQGYRRERPQHRVRIQPIQMQATAVTRGMYGQFDKHFEVSRDQTKASPPDDAIGEALICSVYPVVNTTWFDAWSFCKWLGSDYRLPSECEWEFACRAGTTTSYHFGDGLAEDHANCVIGHFPRDWPLRPNALLRIISATKQTTPAGSAQYPMNAFGLFDNHGNVGEWVANSRTTTKDFTYSKSDPTYWDFRIVRGGSYRESQDDCRSASARQFRSTLSDNNVGFRVCREF